MRYQRYPAPGDTAEMRKLMDPLKNRGFKNVFLMNSEDGGRTWSAPRMLTTQYGQTFGYPAVQSDGTVVVVHDTRYGPGRLGARALISRDEGKTCQSPETICRQVFFGSGGPKPTPVEYSPRAT